MFRREYEPAIDNLYKQAIPEASVIPLVKVLVEEVKQLCSLQDKRIFQDTDECMHDFGSTSLAWIGFNSTLPLVVIQTVI